ncbi:MAG: 60S ribosomal protein L26, partial [Thermoproteota archaeon]|nr:60S ribosomal protein L26 [Thermoproteota archaeon]
IEGIQREKVRGGQVKVPIHSSNVMVITLNLDDKYRSGWLQGTSKEESRSSEKNNESDKKKEEVKA